MQADKLAGDVITAYSVQNPRHVVCKRVLGLEGDVIRVPWSSTNGPARTVKVAHDAFPCLALIPSLFCNFADHSTALPRAVHMALLH